MKPASIAIPIRIIGRLLIYVTACLAIIGFVSEVLDHLYDYSSRDAAVRLFKMAMEGNIPNWFASALLLTNAILLAIIGLATPSGKGTFRRHWIALAGMFLYISIDETAQLHEMLNSPMRDAFDLGGIFHYAWVIPASAIVAVLAVVYWPFLQALSARSRKLFVLAAMVYVGGALGTEFFVNRWVAHYGIDTMYGTINIVQETMELSGLGIFLVALLGYLRETFSDVRIVVE